MTEKKRRVKTGCLTCRQRRVKCDEGKPTCQRCQAANVYCEGYDTQRHLETRSRSLTVDSSQASSSHIPSTFYPFHPSLVTYRVDGLPIVGCPTNPDCAERVPHPRARDVLAHHQYTFRTAPLLFKEDHLYFWRDRILHTAWIYEYVYDAVLALGTAHRATLFLSQPYERWKGLDTKVIALQMYGDALQRLSGEFRSGKQCMDIQVGVLLLLVYFECFVGNPVAAFRHLRAAKYYFTIAEAELRKRDSTAVEPLNSCIAQLELVAQVLLPLPNISFLGQMSGDLSNATNCGGHVESPERLELHRILATHRDVTQCIVTPLHGSITRLDSQQVNALQTDLRRWRDASDTLFQYCDEEPIMPSAPSSSWASLAGLTIPPRAQYFPSVKAAITVSLYNCFMAHTMWLLSITTNTSSHPCEITAYFYAYQNLRIAEGLLSNNPIRQTNDGRYFSCESLGMGLSPILYLTARCCYSPTWQQWIVEKLRHMGQEGLFNSEALATSLDLLKSYQHTQNTNVLDDQDNVWRSQSPLGPPLSRALPTVLPDPSGRRFIAFYLKVAQRPYNQFPTTPVSLEVVGKASWLVEGSDSSERKRSVDIHTNHLDIKDISQLETELALQGHKWESMFQTPVCEIGCGIDDYESSIPVRSKTPIDT